MPMPKQPGAYSRAGVDIHLGNRLKSTLPKLLAATHRPGVLGKVGGFGGSIRLGHPALPEAGVSVERRRGRDEA
jgi:phosphoribosylaminoimidazole (AIR) synthetase